jgi:hypothetical protein
MWRDSGLPPEDLFVALDGRTVSVGRDRWRVEVFSVVDDEDGSRWVQLAIKGEPDYALTLRLFRSTAAERAIGAIIRWLYDPTPPNGKPLVVT